MRRGASSGIEGTVVFLTRLLQAYETDFVVSVCREIRPRYCYITSYRVIELYISEKGMVIKYFRA